MPRKFTPVIWRLLLGTALIVASIIGTSALVSSLNKSHDMVIAVTSIPVGHTLTRADVSVVDGYVPSSSVRPLASLNDAIGSVTTRPLVRGELITPAVVADKADERLTVLVVSLAAPVSADLGPGETIEIWATGSRSGSIPANPESVVEQPRPIAAGEYVGPGPGSDVVGPGEAQAEVVISKSDMTDLLRAQSAGEGLVVVPAWSRP